MIFCTILIGQSRVSDFDQSSGLSVCTPRHQESGYFGTYSMYVGVTMIHCTPSRRFDVFEGSMQTRFFMYLGP
jgi:hypothetical protein